MPWHGKQHVHRRQQDKGSLWNLGLVVALSSRRVLLPPHYPLLPPPTLFAIVPVPGGEDDMLTEMRKLDPVELKESGAVGRQPHRSTQ